MGTISPTGSIKRLGQPNIKAGIIKSINIKSTKKNMIENIINGKGTQMKSIIPKVGRTIRRISRQRK